jgi:hypothetical protein
MQQRQRVCGPGAFFCCCLVGISLVLLDLGM